MIRYILKRLLMLIPVILAVIFIIFCIMDLTPGDPARIILGDDATAESVAALREELGLNKPLPVRYLNYVGDMLRGDLGKSYKTGISVMYQIQKKLPNTAILSLAGILIAVCVGIPVGILSAKKQYTVFDNVSMVAALIGTSAPAFWVGLILVIIFSLKLSWLPSGGMGEGFIDLIKSLILPAITLGMSSAALIARMTRSSILEVKRQEYIDTARAKGIKESQVTMKHMLGNALIPIVTVVGLQFGAMLGGSVMTENVFAWPGVGRFVIESIKEKDVPSVLGTVVVLSILFSCVNLAVDILYAFIDPRIKMQYRRSRRSANE